MLQEAGASASSPSRASDTEDPELAALLDQELAGLSDSDAAASARSPAHSTASRDRSQEASPSTVDPPAAKRRRTSEQQEHGAAPPICPPHPGFMRGICIRCGAAADESAEAGVALRYIHDGLEISRQEAERVRAAALRALVAGRKLALVLDLDHTLLHSARLAEVAPEHLPWLDALRAQQAGQPLPSLHRLEHMGMWTKLRPGLAEFLEAAHGLYELHIYTHGDREYARQVAHLVDPDRRYFASRVISQGDSTARHAKHLDVVLAADTAVLILDDTAAVWPEHRANLLPVERYLFFPAPQFGAGRPSLLEQRSDEDGAAGALAQLLRVLKEVHARVFASAKPEAEDVREHLRAVRQQVLAGVTVLFTRVIPLAHQPPCSHPTWQLVVELGGRCVAQAGPEVTHVVAGGDGTDKVVWAREAGLPVVTPDWLTACALTWSRVEEAAYALGGQDGGAGAAQWAPPARLDAQADLAAALATAGGGRGQRDEDPG